MNEEITQQDDEIKENGQASLIHNPEKHRIHLFTIIGEIEGHENLPGSSKTTKYEHLLPRLAAIEDSEKVDGVLIML